MGLPQRPEDAEHRGPIDAAPDLPEDRRVGRRVVLGMVGLGALGVLVGARVQSGIERALRPLTQDGNGLASLLPTGGRFRLYTVTGDFPAMAAADYRLRVEGLVDRPTTFDLAALRDELPQTELTRDFQCVTGWRVPDVPWRGVLLRDLLEHVGVRSTTSGHVRFRSFDGVYTETLSMEQAVRDDVLVAHHMEGRPVSREHGGPVRLYVAPMYGYKSLKWLDRIEVDDALDEPTDPGYWENLGYDNDAWVGGSNRRTDEPT